MNFKPQLKASPTLIILKNYFSFRVLPALRFYSVKVDTFMQLFFINKDFLIFNVIHPQ